MASKLTPPSITLTAFDCPHCGAFTTQNWFDVRAGRAKERTPMVPDEAAQKTALANLAPEHVEYFTKWVQQMNGGLVFFEKQESAWYGALIAHNLFLSQCYNCNKVAIWVNRNLVFPAHRVGEAPNANLPEDIIRDFEEARSILNLSPRGAAALLRLAVQKLCVFLGERGENINDDIASLVRKGLDPLVQMSLDLVRVIGNEAVHPGSLDLQDDRETALGLLELVNIIADKMISHPRS